MKIKNPRKIHERFLILPFYCEDCGERFMLEQGAIEENPNYEIFSFLIGYHKYHKYCYKCAIKRFEKAYELEEGNNENWR